MSEHQINELLKVALGNINQMLDINLTIGETINIGYASIIPVAKVKTTFISGGIDQKINKQSNDYDYPFGGAVGGTLNIIPIGFLVCMNNEVKLLHLDDSTHLVEKAIDSGLEIINKIINQTMGRKDNLYNGEKNSPKIKVVEKAY